MLQFHQILLLNFVKENGLQDDDDLRNGPPNSLETSINFAYKNNLEFVSSRSINKDNNIAEKTHKLYSDYFNTKIP